jgi:hypothetical protein
MDLSSSGIIYRLMTHLTQLLQKKPENKGAGPSGPHPFFRVTKYGGFFLNNKMWVKNINK